MKNRYFVVQTQPSADGIAAANLLNQGFDVFQPTITVERKHPRYQRVTSEVIEPLFPGYLFVRFDLSDARWRSVNGTRGVKGLLGAGEQPIPVPVGIVEDIQRRLTAGEFTPRAVRGPRLKRGELGQVTAGPFSGFIGECLASRRDRVKLLLNIFGRRTETWLVTEAVGRA